MSLLLLLSGSESAPAGLAPLSMPTGASAIYSVWRVNSYEGNVAEVVRAVGGATEDIAFDGNVWDAADLNNNDAFSKWYDQSGNDRHATQTTSGSRPFFRPSSSWGNNVTGVTFQQDFLDIPAGVSIDRRSCTIYCVLAPQASTPTTTAWGFNSTFANGIGLNIGCDASTRIVHSAFSTTGLYTPSQPVIITVVSDASGVTIYQNGEVQSIGALTTSTSNGGYLGRLNSSGWDLYGEMFMFAAYAGVAHNEAQVQAVHSQIYNRLNINSNKRRRILAVGDSLTWGQGSSGIPYTRRLELLLNDPLIEIRNVGVPGREVLGTDGMLDELGTNIINSYREDYQNYLILWGGTNDVFSGDTAANVYGADNTAGLRKIITDAKAAGYRVALANIIARTSSDTSYQTERTNLNTSIAGNAAAANRLFDLAARFDDSTDPADYTDGVHLTPAAYQDLAELIDAGVASDFADEAPSQVEGLILVSGSGEITASWDKAFVWGPVATYTVEYKESASGTWLVWATGVTGLTSTITGLTNGVSYDVRVKGVNTIGDGDESATASATPFSIAAIPQLRVWLDSTSNVSASGDDVNSWTDKSSNAYVFTASGSARPKTGISTLNGLNVISFDNTDDKMTATIASGLTSGSTIFFVLNTADVAYIPIHAPSRFAFVAQQFNATTTLSAGSGTPTYRKNGVSITPADRNAAYNEFSTGTNILVIENIDLSAWGEISFGNYASFFYSNFPHAEILIFDSGLSTANKNNIGNYLKARWNAAGWTNI